MLVKIIKNPRNCCKIFNHSPCGKVFAFTFYLDKPALDFYRCSLFGEPGVMWAHIFISWGKEDGRSSLQD